MSKSDTPRRAMTFLMSRRVIGDGAESKTTQRNVPDVDGDGATDVNSAVVQWCLMCNGDKNHV